MTGIILLQLAVMGIVALAIYKTGYFRGAEHERKNDIRPRQTTFDAGSHCEQGLRSCREANELHRQVNRINGSNDR